VVAIASAFFRKHARDAGLRNRDRDFICRRRIERVVLVARDSTSRALGVPQRQKLLEEPPRDDEPEPPICHPLRFH
jgi:hypothetical protein